jgi:type IV pilus assembly protein PilC
MSLGADVSKFAYVATDPDGRRVKGYQDAENRQAAEFLLSRGHLTNIRVTQRQSVMQFEVFGSTVKREEIMHLSRQLGAFIRAGLPLVEAVHILGEEAGNAALKRIMLEVEDGLRRGETLTDCLDRHPRAFPAFYRGILRSAELTGQLDSVLDQLAKYLERDMEARRKIKAALIYPTIVAAMSVATVIILAAFVLPRFKTFFTSLNAKLPLPTRILLSVTDFVANWWWAMVAVAVLLALVYALAVRTEGGRLARDKVLLRLPVIGAAVRFALVERFCRVLASMAGAGVALPEAMRVASDSVRNLVFTRSLASVSESMLHGEGLAAPLSRTKLFPGTAARMIRVGEETGTLDLQLEVIAKYYESELDYKLKKITSLFEPAVIVVMGLVVGFVAVALVSAMYGIFSSTSV